MYARTIGGLTRQRALGVVAVMTLLAGAGLLLLRQAAAQSVRDEHAAAARLRDAGAAAARYAFLAAEEVKLSGDPVEARSNEALMAALGNNGLLGPADQRQISYDEPEDTSDGRQRLRINIQCGDVPLAGIIGFLRELESARKNLALLSVEIGRDKPAVDSWDVHFVYGAVISRQAKSRN